MRLGTVKQQPGEKLSYTVEYEDVLTENDEVESAVVLASPSGLIISNVSIFPNRVRFWVNGGTDGLTYKVTLSVTTADGRVFEDELTFRIKDL